MIKYVVFIAIVAILGVSIASYFVYQNNKKWVANTIARVLRLLPKDIKKLLKKQGIIIS